jgi:hypothetical protein
MISWKGEVLFDNTFSFGASSSPGIFGRLADLLVHLLKHLSIEEILKWVDDFVFFRYPNGRRGGKFIYKYDESIFFEIADDLGWPWEISKHTPFSPRFTYLGLDWDIEVKTVTLPNKKREKYLRKLESWISGARVSKKETENVVGTLNHCAYIITQGRSRLVSLYKLTASFNKAANAFVKYTISQNVGADIEWWRKALSAEKVFRKVREPPPMHPDEIFVDASTSWGVGFVFQGKWLAWRYREGWRADGRNIGWGEMVAVELAIRTLVTAGYRGAHFALRSDNQGVIGALAAGRSYGMQENAILQRIIRLYEEYDIWLTISYVPTEQNISDGPSRGKFPPTNKLYPFPPKIPAHLKPLIRHSSERSRE